MGAKNLHALPPKNQNRKQKQHCNKFNKDLKKMAHIKKKNKTPNHKDSSKLSPRGMKLCILAVGPPLSDIHRLPNCNENKPQTLHAERPRRVNPLASLISHPQPLPTVVWPHWPLSCSLNRRSSCQAEACAVTCVRTLLPTEGAPVVPEVPEPPNSPGPCPACSPSQHLMLHRTISIG